MNKDSVSDLVTTLVLPGLPEHRLRTLARLVGIEVPGFRAGKEPGERLVGAIGKRIHQEQSALDRVTSWLRRENEDLSRLIASRKLADLKTGLPRLVEEHQLGPVLFCLLMDGRRGMGKLFADYGRRGTHQIGSRYAGRGRHGAGSYSAGSHGAGQEPTRRATTPIHGGPS